MKRSKNPNSQSIRTPILTTKTKTIKRNEQLPWSIELDDNEGVLCDRLREVRHIEGEHRRRLLRFTLLRQSRQYARGNGQRYDGAMDPNPRDRHESAKLMVIFH